MENHCKENLSTWPNVITKARVIIGPKQGMKIFVHTHKSTHEFFFLKFNSIIVEATYLVK